MGMAAHSACLSGLTINFTTGRISPPRRGEGLTPFDMAYLMIVTMTVPSTAMVTKTGQGKIVRI